jgi:hypothetical protein
MRASYLFATALSRDLRLVEGTFVE